MWKNPQNDLILAQTKDVLGVISFEVLNQDDINYLFPNKVRDLKGSSINGIMFHQYPSIWLQNGVLVGRDVLFLDFFIKHLNGTFDILSFDSNFVEKEQAKMYDIFSTTDLVLNTGITVSARTEKFRQIWTHEMLGYCALIPKSPPIPFFYYLLSPFDSITWILTSLSVAFASILWHFINTKRLTRSRHSTGYFLFQIYSMFVGQSLNMFKLCLLQTCIIQLFVFLIFIIGNCYQSIIISLMSEKRDARFINSFDDLKNSDFTVKANGLFYDRVVMSGLDQSWQKKLIRSSELNNYLEEYYIQNLALIVKCDVAEILIYSSFLNNSHFYYMISETIDAHNNFYLSAKDHNIIGDSLELFANKIFESGIRQHWKNFQVFKDVRNEEEANFLLNEEFLLKMNDMVFIFYLLGIGLAVACVAFLFELLWPAQAKLNLRKSIRRSFRRTFRQSKK